MLAQVSVPQAGCQEEEEVEEEEEEVAGEPGETNKSEELTAPGCNGTAMRQGSYYHSSSPSLIAAGRGPRSQL